MSGTAVGALAQLASASFQLSFQISPIFLTGGIAATQNGGVIPIVQLLQTAAPSLFGGILQLEDVVTSLANGNVPDVLDNYFAQFNVLPGGTLAANAVGTYPFANQSVAANAIIAQPLRVSLEMICPASTYFPYSSKIGIMTALQSALSQHTQQGGLFTVATPSFIYTNAILTDLADITTGETEQRQTRWQWNFVQPLVTLQQAQQAQNMQMQKISSGVQTDGTSSGPNVSTGNPQASVYPYQPGSLVG